jgi:CheY-like chemotaxis protein/two-component sensor histidine kinase
MNNVLGAIMAVASLLKARHPDTPTIVKDAEALLQAAIRGRDLVKGLRDFSRKDLDSAVRLDLNELVRQEADLLERTTLKKMAIVLDLEAGLPEFFGEASALANALMNLCMNAYDAMPGGGRITLSTRFQRPGALVLTIQDDGEGMPQDVLARAMEPFFTTKPTGKGTGLGLSQVYGTMRAHGGSMDIQSQPGRGTRVTLTFPLAADQEPVGANVETALTSPQRALRVLMVDDDDLMRETFLSMLEVVGHHPQGVSGGREALRHMTDGPLPDLVIMDINMPEMDGLETLGHLRSRWPRIPVLMLSGYVDDRAQALLEQFPGVRVLKKPCDMTDLRRVLQDWV